VLSQQLWEVLPEGHAALFHLDQHLAWDQGISEPHASASPTLGNLVLKAHTGFCGIRPAPGTEQLLNEGLALLLLVAAAAGGPLGKGVERFDLPWLGLCPPILSPARGLSAPSSDSQLAAHHPMREKWPRQL